MINYVVGDATEPQGDGDKLIVHVVNNLGGWGKGFVVALSKRWGAPEKRYRAWCAAGNYDLPIGQKVPFKLGQIQMVSVTDEITVINMIAQHGYYPKTKGPFIRYDALESCLESVARFANSSQQRSVHMPRIGCGLAGGHWGQVEPILERTLVAADVPVFVYDLPS